MLAISGYRPSGKLHLLVICQAQIMVQHENILLPHDKSIILQSLQSMITHLDQAALTSADPPEVAHVETTHIVHSGHRGRPRIEIDRDILATAIEMRGPTNLAPTFGVSARTVRRRALEAGLVDPGQPVYIEYEAEDGSCQRYYTSSTAPMSDLSNDELDVITRQILDAFPD